MVEVPLDELVDLDARPRCQSADGAARDECVPSHGKTGATIAVFRSGRGEGEYVTYFGLRGRDLVCVTTDFGL